MRKLFAPNICCLIKFCLLFIGTSLVTIWWTLTKQILRRASWGSPTISAAGGRIQCNPETRSRCLCWAGGSAFCFVTLDLQPLLTFMFSVFRFATLGKSWAGGSALPSATLEKRLIMSVKVLHPFLTFMFSFFELCWYWNWQYAVDPIFGGAEFKVAASVLRYRLKWLRLPPHETGDFNFYPNILQKSCHCISKVWNWLWRARHIVDFLKKLHWQKWRYNLQEITEVFLKLDSLIVHKL